MTLQDRFEEIIMNNDDNWRTEFKTTQASKECSKLCLEEQIDTAENCYEMARCDSLFEISNIIKELQQQLKELENGTTNSK